MYFVLGFKRKILMPVAVVLDSQVPFTPLPFGFYSVLGFTKLPFKLYNTSSNRLPESVFKKIVTHLTTALRRVVSGLIQFRKVKNLLVTPD